MKDTDDDNFVGDDSIVDQERKVADPGSPNIFVDDLMRLRELVDLPQTVIHGL